MPSEGALRNGNDSFQLIETMRWESGIGFVRLDRHLARLYASATELGFEAVPEVIGEALREAVGDRVPLRVRLTLSKAGEAKAVTQLYEPIAPGSVWKLKIAHTRLDSADALLRHKTTRRDLYVRARAEFMVQQADEVLLLNERGEVCEGTITNVFVDVNGGKLLTPPVTCGLLPGVLRGELLESGRAREEALNLDALASARAIYVGNSLRGLILAQFAV